jgi:hypothetical protein
MDAEAQYTKVFLSLTAQEVRDLWAKDPQLVRDMLADTWGSENDAISGKLIDSGVAVD